MPKLPVINAKEAGRLLLKAGFILIRTKGSHHIYMKNKIRVVVPFHGKKILHPKIIKQLFEAIDISK